MAFLVRFSGCSSLGLSVPTSFQSSDSIIKGPEARNYPRSGTCMVFGGLRPQVANGPSTRWRDSGGRETGKTADCPGGWCPLAWVAADRPGSAKGTFRCRVAYGETPMASTWSVARGGETVRCRGRPVDFWRQCRRGAMVLARHVGRTGRGWPGCRRLPATGVLARPQPARFRYRGRWRRWCRTPSWLNRTPCGDRPSEESAAKISPANLVHYATREEALKAGKRPCASVSRDSIPLSRLRLSVLL